MYRQRTHTYSRKLHGKMKMVNTIYSNERSVLGSSILINVWLVWSTGLIKIIKFNFIWKQRKQGAATSRLVDVACCFLITIQYQGIPHFSLTHAHIYKEAQLSLSLSSHLSFCRVHRLRYLFKLCLFFQFSSPLFLDCFVFYYFYFLVMNTCVGVLYFCF